MSRISVIVPVYKVEPYLRRCVDSILVQTHRDFELILVDDGSPDRSGTICDEYARKDARVVALHRANGGLSSARNAGLDWIRDHSASTWIAFVDGDDWIHPKMLQSLLSTGEANRCRISACGYDRPLGPEEPQDGIGLEDHYDLLDADDFVAWCYGKPDYRFMLNDIACGKLYERALFSSLRFPERYRAHEDTFTTYRAVFAAGRIAATTAPLYHYFPNRQSIMGADWNPEWLNVLLANREQIRFFQGGFPKALDVALHAYVHHASRLHRLAAAAKDRSAQLRIRADLRAFIVEHWRALLGFEKTPWDAYEIFIPGLRPVRRVWGDIHRFFLP